MVLSLQRVVVNAALLSCGVCREPSCALSGYRRPNKADPEYIFNKKNPRAWPIVQKPAAPATTPTTVQPPAAPKMRFKVEGTWFRSWFGDVEDDPMEY